MNNEPVELVLTGGPCGGKTSFQAYAQEKLADHGFTPFFPPEVATMLINGGKLNMARIAKYEPELMFELEKQFLLMQGSLRQRFRDLASKFENPVIIWDRAEMDVAAYMSPEEFRACTEELNINTHSIRDSYHGVIHLVTAARGAAQFYTLENNPARSETPYQACQLDQRIQQAWLGHPHLRIIDNSSDFDLKMKRALKAVFRMLGIPAPLEIEKKFVVKIPDFNIPELQEAKEIFIEQIYITTDDDTELRIRRRSQGNFSTYYLTRKKHLRSGVREETEKFIMPGEYLMLARRRKPNTEPIVKNRYHFIYNRQCFELDIFLSPDHIKGLALLEIELTEENDEVMLPPFIDVIKDVTNEREFSNSSLAKSS